MKKEDRPKIVIDREKEMRTKETSRMINEGGLGSRTHYNIEKVSSPKQEIQKSHDKNKDVKDKD